MSSLALLNLPLYVGHCGVYCVTALHICGGPRVPAVTTNDLGTISVYYKYFSIPRSHFAAAVQTGLLCFNIPLRN